MKHPVVLFVFMAFGFWVLTPNAMADVTSGLVGYWTFDEGSGMIANDYSVTGNWGLLTGGPTWITGRLGGALSFSGKSYVQAMANGPVGAGNVTTSAWIRTSASDVALFAYGDDYFNSYTFYRIYVGKDEIYMRTGVGQIGFSAPNITDNNWHHVVVVVPPGSTLTNTLFYLDGTLLTNRTRNTSPQQPWNIAAGEAITIGADAPSNGFASPFNGAIDDVRIYNRALTAGDVAELYGGVPAVAPPAVAPPAVAPPAVTPPAVTPPAVAPPAVAPPAATSGLVGYWTFDEGSGTIANDYSGFGKMGTLKNGPTWVTGKLGGALSFSGNSYVQTMANGPVGAGNVTTSAWIKTSASDVALFAYGDDYFSSYTFYRIYVGKDEIYMRTGVGQIGSSAPNITDNNWHHLVVVVPPGSTLTNTLFYMDGTLLTNRTRNTNPQQPWNIAAGEAITIGADAPSNGFASPFNGAIDDVRIYNRALTNTEVSQIYAFAGGAPAPVQSFPTSAITSPVNTAQLTYSITVAINTSYTSGTGNSIASVQLQVDGTVVGSAAGGAVSCSGETCTQPYSIIWDSRTVPNGSHLLTAVATNASGNSAASPAVQITINNIPGPDTTPPVISSISITSITASSATISWSTNEPADTQIYYGANSIADNATSWSPSLVTSHSQTIAGLAANSLYHYQVRSRDAAGNLAVTITDRTFVTAPVTPPVAPSTPASDAYYVSLTGNDNNPGTQSAPFRTVQRAQAAVRSINSVMWSDITVYLRQGTYELSSTLTFDARDSGTNGHNVIYASYPGERATISGGRPISGWTYVANGIYKASALGLNFRQLYVNGVAGIRARNPNSGSYNRMVGWDVSNRFAIVKFADLQRWSRFSEVEFVINLEWTHYAFHMADFMEGAGVRIIIPKERDMVFVGHGEHKSFPDQPYYFENAYEFLDSPGEWYLDQSRGEVFYIPRAGEDLSSAVVMAPNVERLVQIQGGSLDSPVQNVQFYGITFEYANWNAPNTVGFFNAYGDNRQLGPGQFTPIPGAVHIQNAINLRFERNIFRKLGGTAVLLYTGVSGGNFIGNVFQDIAASGIALDAVYAEPNFYRYNPWGADSRGMVRNNTIKNNYFNRVAREYTGSMGVFATYVQGLLVEHNEFYDMPYNAVSVGTASWAYQEVTPVGNNVIRYNKIHSVMNLMADGGGLYVMSNQPGTTIFENYVYDLWKSPWAGHLGVIGIYLDNFSANMTVQNNINENMDMQWANFVNTGSFNNTFINFTGNLVDAGKQSKIIMNGDINPSAIKANSGIEPAYQDILR